MRASRAAAADVRRWTGGHEGDAAHQDRLSSTSRQKASTRAFHSSGTSWKGWWASSSITSKRARGISSATSRQSSGRLVESRPPASTSVGAEISGRRSLASWSMKASRERCRSSVACL